MLITILILFACFIFFLQRAKKSTIPVRRLAPIDAIEEGIGRAVELGRPVHWTPGYGSAEHGGGVGSTSGLSLLSGMTILAYVAKICAQRGAELIATFANPELVPLASELVKDAYVSENKLDEFKSENIRFISSRQYAFSTGLLGLFQRERIATNIMTGDIKAEALIVAEGAQIAGAFQVAGSDGTTQLPVIFAICDYTLIGEEFFAAAAYLSNDPINRGALRGQDVFKFGLIIFTIVATIVTFLGFTIVNYLKM